MFKLDHWIKALRSHPGGFFEKGQFLKVIGIRLPFCKCHDYLVDIGETSASTLQKCERCNVVFRTNDYNCWFSNHSFEEADEEFRDLIKVLLKDENNK